MSALTEMSRAIRLVLQSHSADGTLNGIPTPTLKDFAELVGAFAADLEDELQRRDRSPKP